MTSRTKRKTALREAARLGNPLPALDYRDYLLSACVKLRHSINQAKSLNRRVHVFYPEWKKDIFETALKALAAETQGLQVYLWGATDDYGQLSITFAPPGMGLDPDTHRWID